MMNTHCGLLQAHFVIMYYAGGSFPSVEKVPSLIAILYNKD